MPLAGKRGWTQKRELREVFRKQMFRKEGTGGMGEVIASARGDLIIPRRRSPAPLAGKQ